MEFRGIGETDFQLKALKMKAQDSENSRSVWLKANDRQVVQLIDKARRGVKSSGILFES